MEQVWNAVKEKIGKFTKSEIMEMVPSLGKASVENSLKRLVEEGFIMRRGKGKKYFLYTDRYMTFYQASAYRADAIF